MTDPAQQPGADIFVGEITAVTAPVSGYAIHAWKEKYLDPVSYKYQDNPLGRKGTATLSPAVTLDGSAAPVGSFVFMRLRSKTALTVAGTNIFDLYDILGIAPGSGGGTGGSCCDPATVLGGVCCPPILGGGGGDGSIPCCVYATMKISCPDAGYIAGFIACKDSKGNATFTVQSVQIILSGFGGPCGVQSFTALGVVPQSGSDCSTPAWASGTSLMTYAGQALALLPSYISKCCTGGVGGGGGVGGLDQQACIDQCTVDCNAVYGAGTPEAAACINACIQAKGCVAKTGVGVASPAADSGGGCASCGSVVGSAYAPPNPSCACQDSHANPPITTEPGILGQQALGITGLGGVDLLGGVSSQLTSLITSTTTIVPTTVTLNTTDATVTTIVTVACADETQTTIFANISVIPTGGGAAVYSVDFVVKAYRTGAGAVTFMANSPFKNNETGGIPLGFGGVTEAASSGNCLIQVSGKAATNYTWKISYTTFTNP